MKFFQPSLVLFGAAILVTAEDSLVSHQNLHKRFIDSEGNYNICELSFPQMKNFILTIRSLLPHKRRPRPSR